MPRVNPIVISLARFVIVAALLLVPWPGVDRIYAGMVRATGQFVFGSFASKAIVKFKPIDPPNSASEDTVILLGNRERVAPNGEWWALQVNYNSRSIAYLPTALVLALILATPLPWKRRARALIWGMLLVNCFIGCFIGLLIWDRYNQDPWLSLFVLKPGLMRTVLHGIYETFVGYFGARLIVAVLIWLIVSFQREDWSKCFKAVPTSA